MADSHDTECSPTTGETGAAVTGPATINLEATSEPDAAIVLNKRDRLRRPANFKSATISMDWEANDD